MMSCRKVFTPLITAISRARTFVGRRSEICLILCSAISQMLLIRPLISSLMLRISAMTLQKSFTDERRHSGEDGSPEGLACMEL
jgi:hypothetical protein